MPLHTRRHLARCVAACLASLVVVACTHQSSEEGAAVADASAGASSAAASANAPATVDPDSPCRLLTEAEVRAVFPGAKPGERDRSREEYGISACQWRGDRGYLVVQVWKAEDGSAEDEIRGLAQGFIDPLKPAAGNNIRYEAVAGVGEQAFAVVETQDAPRGILNDVAMLMTRHDDQILMLGSDDLARRERGEALAALQSLGGSAAKRL